jgi:hypothetical protein
MEDVAKSRRTWLIAGVAGVAAIASQPSAAAPFVNPAYVVNGAGTIACSDYVLDRQTTAPTMLAASVWFYGLISGINFLSPDGAQIRIKTMAPLLAHADLYCAKHLKEPFANAALNVVATILAQARHPLSFPPAAAPDNNYSGARQ